jgi:hypothetical protein
MICPACGADCLPLRPDRAPACSECDWTAAPIRPVPLGGLVARPVNGTRPIVFAFRCACGFETVEAKAMLAHQREKHPTMK